MNLEKHFENIGAHLDIVRVRQLGGRPYDLNVTGKGRNERFVLRLTGSAPEFQILQANKVARHLLILAKDVERPIGGQRLRWRENPRTEKVNERFLCGHDERHWFAASVGGAVSTITEARRSLLPVQLKDQSWSADELTQRHGARFKRQGEWFFVPADTSSIVGFDKAQIHRSEPLLRPGGGKPHLVSELIRFRGIPVVVAGSKEYSMDEWSALDPKDRPRYYRMMHKDPEVYVRGPIRHPDHATLILPDWHRVFVNSEARSANLSFYD